MHVRGAGFAFGARLRMGPAPRRGGLCVQVRLARGVPSLAIRSSRLGCRAFFRSRFVLGAAWPTCLSSLRPQSAPASCER